MKVRNLVFWAGLGFSYEPGDEIDLSEATARARAAVGLVEIIETDLAVDPPSRTTRRTQR